MDKKWSNGKNGQKKIVDKIGKKTKINLEKWVKIKKWTKILKSGRK